MSFLNTSRLRQTLSEAGVENPDEKIAEAEAELSKIIKRLIKESQPVIDEQYNAAEPFLKVYPEYNSKNLPRWIIDNLEEARILGNAGQTVIFPDGRRYQLNNTLNHLTGKAWTHFINSVINTAYSTNGKDSYAHKIRKIHPTPKPPQLMRDIIEFFTKENEIVFDYFMGVGGSLLGAGLCNRRASGIELNPEYIKAYQMAAAEIKCPEFSCRAGDCLEILSDQSEMADLIGDEKISLVLIDPPYGNMMSREKTGADIEKYGNTATPFTDSDRDLGNVDLHVFFEKLKRSVELVLPYVKRRGHIVIFIKDLQPSKKETNLLHAQIIDKLNEIDCLHYKGLKIWADQTTKLFPYGYPFAFVANQIHQYILVFRKEKP